MLIHKKNPVTQAGLLSTTPTGNRAKGKIDCVKDNGDPGGHIDKQTVVDRGKTRGMEGERENSNSKTLFYKDCSLGSVKNLSNN